MADNYLITGYWGEPHVTAENDRGINAAMFGAGRFVLPVGEQFKAEYIGNNTIRMYDGKLMDNGAAAGIPVGEYVDLLIANAGQGMKRNDLIVFQYKQDASTLIESGTFVVIQGTESSGTASDPALTQEDLLSGEAAFDQMALWRVPVSGTTISAPVKLFSVSKDLPGLKAWAEGAFAPAGYGWGEANALNAPYGDPDYINKTCVFVASQGNIPQAGVWLGRCFINGTGGDMWITAFTGETVGSMCHRQMIDGVWGAWCWVNPPMTPGNEYRTTERFDGKVLYKKFVSVGAMPNNSYKAHKVSHENITIVKVNAMVVGSATITLPYADKTRNIWFYSTNASVVFWTSTDESGYSGYAEVWYYKN